MPYIVNKILNFLKKENFEQIKSDKCVFKYMDANKILIIAVHVDDGIDFGDDKEMMEDLI